MSYGPKQWKTGGIIRRAYDICSTNEALQTELAFIKKVFTKINGYPKFLVDRMLQKFREMQTEADTSENNNTSDEIPPEESDKKQTLILKVPFRGDKGQTLIKSLENTLKRTIENKINYRIVHTGTKLSRYFSLKDKVNAKHLSNFIYKHLCRNRKCDDDYIGETSRRKEKREGEHGGKDKESEIFKHALKTKHPKAKSSDFEVLATNYPIRYKRRLAEAMFIRDLKPSLNRQKDSYKLHLFA